MSVVRIEAPDGLIRTIEVPDGADPQPAYDWVKADYEKRRAAAKKEYDPTAGMSGLEKAVVGFGSGLVNKGLGIQQFLNAISGGRIGDKAALDAQVAEKKALDRPLTGGGLTSIGGAAEAVGEMVPDLMMGGPLALGRRAVAGFLPRVAAKAQFRIPGALATGAAEGALQNATTAAEDYDLGREAKQGAMFGVGGEVAGRALGRVATPFRNLGPSRTAAEQFDVLERAGIPSPVAMNMTDNRNVKITTDALAQLPFFNKALNASQDANLGWFTKRKTGQAGSPMTELVPSEATAVRDRLGATGDAFRAGPDVPLTNVPADLATLHGQMADATMATGGNQNRLIQLLNNATVQPTYSADAIMTARQKASDQAFGHRTAGRFLEADNAKALQRIYEDALRATHADGGEAFNLWKRQHGAWADVERAAAQETGQTARQLDPGRFSAKNLDTRRRASPQGEDVFNNAAANRLPSLPKTENRAWITAMLMGTPLVGGFAGGAFSDNDPGKIAFGAVVPPAALMAAGQLLGTRGGGRYLLGRHRGQGQTARDLYRELLTAGAQQAHD